MDDSKKYEHLKLSNQICFPLYAASKEIVRKYQPFLSVLDLTYTQYLAMLVLWEHKSLNIKALGKCLFLDSGTLTPLVKKLEEKNLVTRTRKHDDERNVIVSLTKKGEDLKDKASSIPFQIAGCIPLSENDAKELYTILYKILNNLGE